MYKQEKDRRDINRRPPPFSLPKATPSQNHLVDSIIEDDEENPSPQPRIRQGSVSSQRSSPLAAIFPSRIRSVSISSTGIRSATKNLMRSPSVQAPPSSLSRKMPGTEMLKIRDVRKPPDIGIPTRTRTRQHRRDSLDIEDVMNGSDDDGYQGSVSSKQKLSPPAAPQRISRAQYPVSAHTRDLMAFLAEGPPPEKPKLSQSGSELFEFLAQGPPDSAGSPTMDSSKPKSAGRLQKMISKLSIGGEKARTGSDTSSYKQPNSPARSTISTKPSITTLSSLANRPILPRPVPSPQYSYDEDKSICPPSPLRKSNHDIPPPHEIPLVVAPKPAVPSDTQEKRSLTTHVNGIGNAKNGQSIKEVNSELQQPFSPVRTVSRKAVPSIDPPSPSIPFFTETDAKDMQRLLTHATTADECRLIFNMFMARSGLTKGSVPETNASSPSSSSFLVKNAPAPLVHSSVGEALIESTLIEFFLSGTALPDNISRVFSEQNQPDDDATEELPGTTEAQANVNPPDSLSPSNRRRVPVSPVPISQQPPS